ncbi:TRAP transporter small permease [Thalassorhabdomicrobium marinisediminis]|uniref:TRAP transporter small permease n=1 Tax=Thalassorhabdomicrobium marinisediminis TaxID=2170577 RepID=UPI002491B78E|nr:TRAP transporter small permease [Thalassorhabdomicrobium marinisediminis]
MLIRAERLSEMISKPTAIIGVAFLLVASGLTIADVVSRWVFSKPLIFVHDLFGLSIILVVAATFPTGVLQRKHVAIQFFGTWMGRHASRILDSFAALMTAVFLAVVAWQVTDVAMTKAEINDYTYVLRLPTAPVWWAAAIIIWISVPMQVVVFFLRLLGADTPKTSELPHGE